MQPETERRAVKQVMRCPNCASGTLRREAREGFLEDKVYSWFGYFPWSCYLCRKRTMVRDRGSSKRSATKSK